MAFLANVLAAFAFLGLVGGFIGIIYPPVVKLKTRKQALQGIAIAFVVLIIASIMLPSDSNNDDKNTSNLKPDIEGSNSDLVKNEQIIKAKAYEYKVVGAKDYSTKKRKGGLWHIVSSAVTKEDRSATSMKAAQQLFSELNDPSQAIVWLFLDEEYYQVTGSGQVGVVKYIPDGKGENGVEENGKIWNIQISDTQISPEQKKLIATWYQNRDKFKNKDNSIDEDKLIAFLANKFQLSEDEFWKSMPPYFASHPKETHPNNVKYDIEVIGTKSLDSIKNPASFSISACQQDIQCWGNKHGIRASSACSPYIERLAKYDFEWTDGWLDSKFPYFRWQNRQKGVITFIGDKIKFQNGFGAWQRYSYECDYLPNNDGNLGSVLDVRAEVGRL